MVKPIGLVKPVENSVVRRQVESPGLWLSRVLQVPRPRGEAAAGDPPSCRCVPRGLLP